MTEKRAVHLQFQGDNPDGKSEDRAMPPVLVPIMAVGMTSVPGGVCLLGKDTVVYPVGRSLAMYCPSQLSTVRISEPLRAVRGITALALSPNKKILAAAESMAEGYTPQVTLFDATTLERSLTLTASTTTGTYTYLAFSADSSLLLATATEEGGGGGGGGGGGSSGAASLTSTFHLWEWASATTPRCSGAMNRGEVAIRAALDPRYDANVLVMCAKSVGLFRQSPNGFKRHPVEGLEMALREAAFVDLATLSDGRFLIATSSRQVFLVDRTHAHLAFYTDRPVACMVGLPDGAVAVGTERGYLQLYRRSGNNETAHYCGCAIYSETRVPETVLSVSLDNHVRAMAVGPGGETLLCATAGGGPTYLFNLAYARTLALSSDPANDLWEVLLPGCHEQGIISASLAYKRDFLATASKDLTVRVWQTSPLRLVLTHMCHHSPLSLSIDPYGRELVVAYVDGVRCYSIVEGLLRQLAVLAGHYEAVLDVSWSDDGLYLATAGEGAVFTWAMDGFSRVQENTSKLYLNDAIACTPDFRTLAVGDTTQGLRIMETNRTTAQLGPNGASEPDTPPDTPADNAGGNGVSAGGAAAATAAATVAASPSTPGKHGGGNGTSAGGAAAAGGGGGGGGGSPGADVFRVPGRASLVPIGADPGGGSAATPGHRSGKIMRLHGGPMAVLSAGYAVILGTGVLGRVRMCPLRPRGNDDVDEYFMHAADVTQPGRPWRRPPPPPPAAAAALTPPPPQLPPPPPPPSRQSIPGGGGGGMTLTNRSISGLAAAALAGQLGTHAERTTAAHRLMQLLMSAAAAGGKAPVGVAAGAGPAAAASAGGPSADGSVGGGAPAAQLIVSVRAVDLQNLKESQRELKDRLAKAATEAEYKMYEREQAVRREFEGEVSRLRHEVEVLRADLEYTRTTANDEAAMTRDFERALREQQDMFEKKLAAEISRTDAAEREMQRLRAKFGRKLWQLDEQQGAIVREATERQSELEQIIEATKQDAQKAIAAAHIQTEQELRIDGELNEEELQRAADAAQKQLEEKDEAYLKLLAKHTLQSGLNAKTTQENERLRVEAEALRKENTRLAEQVMALTEELEAMQNAWADRDARQRHQDAEMKDLAFQWQQSQLFSTLATSRIKELNNELEPIKASRTEALAHVAQMESVAQRQLERQAKVVSENASLQSRLDAAYDELKKASVKGDMLEREAYFKNFTTQLFRTIQDVPHQHWPKLFGRLIDDYHKGRDKASWSRYLAPDHGPNAHPPPEESSRVGGANQPGGAPASDAAATAAEYNEKIAELHAQLIHTEKMLSLLTDTKDKADKARRAVVSKLMADNLMAVQELNDVKRDLKAARELAEKRSIELADLRMSLAVAGTVTTQVTSQGSTTQLPGGGGGGGGVGDSYPQGLAGRAMARLPSRFSDASKNTSGSAAAAEAATTTTAAGGGGGGGGGSLPDHSTTSVSASVHPQPAMVVTGDMPQGGWWLGDNSPFALPSSLDHLTSSSLRQRAVNSSYDGGGGGGGGGDRPGTGGGGLLGRRPATSASTGTSAAVGRIFGGNHHRSTFTPPTPPHALLPGRRADGVATASATSSSAGGSLVAAAVSGAALQAYKVQQQQRDQQRDQQVDSTRSGSPPEGGDGASGADAAGGGGASAAGGPTLQRSLSPPHAPVQRPTRATSAGPVSSSAAAAAAAAAANGGGGGGGGGGALQHTHPSPGHRARVRSTSAVPTLSLGSSHYGSGATLLPPGLTMPFLQGQVRPSTTSKVTTMGAGFRSFVPAQSASGSGSRGGLPSGGGSPACDQHLACPVPAVSGLPPSSRAYSVDAQAPGPSVAAHPVGLPRARSHRRPYGISRGRQIGFYGCRRA
ncbi:hypothetical protein VOLCADRAFT_118871 [Volvox carteri f. nagariensis]|uniref:Uncharacterized protein n=1 Tax=Volvox carteri f. nagariensis TaxID=3068 RepID=D8U882_VOLCA|nr:uncharacterized protein VOLCADRAFT_118871 [Volvox carteri f. nagariensis]EFJ44044.1 hypothetical protein VOLCADRAFT_118871 [Volvox carteri f. nagariensis]|eukprot:XP_002954845.1 hypothetical protein VOLCADRAFT_118871 [Volvox carteri f. nagariensis]